MINIGMPRKAADLPCRNYGKKAQAIHISGFDLWCKQTGKGKENPVVVIIHGGPGMSSCYFQDYLLFLEKKFRVIYYDQRGCGFSQIKPDLKNYTMNVLVNELEMLRKDVARSEKIILIGHSFGGLLAMNYSAQYPGHVESLILISPLSEKINFGASLVMFNKVFFNSGVPPADPEKANAWFLKTIPALFSSSMYERKKIRLLKPGYVSFACMISLIRSLEWENIRKNISDIKTKTLIIYGEAEFITTPERSHQKLHHLIRGSKLSKFYKSGHWTFLEEPDKFEKTIFDFLEANR